MEAVDTNQGFSAAFKKALGTDGGDGGQQTTTQEPAPVTPKEGATTPPPKQEPDGSQSKPPESTPKDGDGFSFSKKTDPPPTEDKQGDVDDADLPEEIKTKSEATREHWKRLEQSKRDEAKARAEAEKRLAQAESELETLRVKAEQSGDTEKLTKEREDLLNEIGRLNLERHPQFKNYFDGGKQNIIAEAKSIVGEENAEAVEAILNAPDGKWKRAALEGLYGELTQNQVSELSGVVRDLRKLDRERADTLAKASDVLKNLEDTEKENRLKQQEASKTQNRSAFQAILKVAQDQSRGLQDFQTIDGNDEHNAQVAENVKQAERLLFGDDVSTDELVQAAFWAQAGKRAQARETLLMTKINQLETQIKKLTKASSPGAGASQTTAGVGDGGSPGFVSFAQRVKKAMGQDE